MQKASKQGALQHHLLCENEKRASPALVTAVPLLQYADASNLKHPDLNHAFAAIQ
ncbi:hypothetical protein L917_11104 [Phytophthora nicotianae]|uniref:Uncharacterized protein n=1 Tax=Phytophthora nicotianae TaxID=4792 RepID=W2L0E6_PHYNI|nr:hypothetical protein L915_11300 [Phytophthora nicotianae]ETL36906.1 hypothetical protein L916_11201 [Phytophthora nicotianae]ETL90080.1 hypothetical protein L917_11104 [Phytophthora nicotianae]